MNLLDTTVIYDEAELKKQQFSLRNERNTFLAQNEQYEKDLVDLNENLIEAKELLRWFVWYFREGRANLLHYKDKLIEVEQFLRGLE